MSQEHVAEKSASLPKVKAKPGQPLYASVKETLVRAIDEGYFPPDKKLPSTKNLSEQMSVSMVTAHRALRELVGEGFLNRARGHGTFIIDRSSRATKKLRISVVIHREVSLVDEHHSRLVEGMRQACVNCSGSDSEIELTVSQYGTQMPRGWLGFLFLDPLDEDLKECLAKLPSGAKKLVVGACQPNPRVSSVGVDNRVLFQLAMDHLIQMGHSRIAYLGSARATGNNQDRWKCFRHACREHGLSDSDATAIRVQGWRLDDRDKLRLFQLLDHSDRPTAIFTAGYNFSLDVYEAAATLGLSIPEDLSILGVGNPSSAGYLSPPLTCIQEPLVELGHASINAILESINGTGNKTPESRKLRPELIVRKSVARP